MTQEDLAELVLLSRLFTEARAKWEEKRDWIRSALRNGADVEPGLLTATLVLRKRPAFNVKACEYYELVIR